MVSALNEEFQELNYDCTVFRAVDYGSLQLNLSVLHAGSKNLVREILHRAQ